MAKRTLKEKEDARCRNWTFLVYEDSAPGNWIEILRDELKLLFVVSPYHQFDHNEDGTPKKPHWHVVLPFEGNKSYDQVKEISNRCSGVEVIPVRSMPGMIQYLIHKNNPEKYQYKKQDIQSFGVDIEQYFGLTPSQMQLEASKMVTFIYTNGVTEFSEFAKMVHDISPDWEYILMNRNTSFFKALLSNRALIRREVEKKCLEEQDRLYKESKERDDRDS